MFEKKFLSVGTEKIKFCVESFCLSSPLILHQTFTLLGSLIASFDRNWETGVEVSKPFPKHQGNPFFRASI